MAYLDDVAAHLATLSIGTVGTDIFVFDMPDDPDVCICLQARGGNAPDPMTTLGRPGLRVLCRNVNTYAGKLAAYDKAYAVKKALHRLVGVTMGTTLYHRIDAQSDPVYNAQDAKGRPMFEISFVCTKEEE